MRHGERLARSRGWCRATGVLLACLAQTCARAAPTPPVKIETIGFAAKGSVSFITRRPGGYAASFTSCRFALLDDQGAVLGKQDAAGCKTVFTVHPGRFRGKDALTASFYTGNVGIITDGQVVTVKAHDAAVTEGFLTFGGLLTASDDGSVTFYADAEAPTTKRMLTTGQGVARVMLPDPTSGTQAPAFFIGFDSGQVQFFDGVRSRAYEPGVGRNNGLALSHDHRSLFVGGFTGKVVRVDLATGGCETLFSGAATVNAISLDDGGTRLAISDDRGHLAVLDASSGKEIFDGAVSAARLTAVALSPDGLTAIAGDANGSLYRVALPPVSR